MALEFYEKYFKFVGLSESPKIYHRWCAVSTVAALLGRNVFLPFGHGAIYPNMYTLLVGSPGTRKGASMKPAAGLIFEIGYKKLASQRISPERFLGEMRELNANDTEEIEDVEIENLTFDQPSEIFVVSEEYGDFIKGNVDFIRLLTTLWDNLPFYRHPKFHGKSVLVHEPTVNILGATTPQDMALTLPIEAIGQGALSRYILVHADPTGIKITFPEAPSSIAKQAVLEDLETIRADVSGRIEVDEKAAELLDKIYKNTPTLDDPRFLYYNTRRFTHLLKLAMVLAAMDKTTKIMVSHVLEANTLLYVTEARMSKALGEFGKAKNADVANIIMERLRSTTKPLLLRDLWRYVAQDLNRLDDLVDIMKNLKEAEKVQIIKTPKGQGWLPLQHIVNGWDHSLLIQNEFLQPEERI